MGPRAHPRRQARPARLSRVAHRGRRRRPRRARRPLLRLRPALGARRAHAEGAARLHERGLDDRRHHAVEGPRLQGRGPEGAHAPSSGALRRATCCCRRSALEGQAKLLDAKVLLLGAGGLGSPTALYLAAAGVGTLGIVDDDDVDLSNLQRQVIHTTDRIGTPKVDSAEEAIAALNPDVDVVKYPDAPRRLQHHGDHRGLRRDRRRRRQLPDALPAQRRDGAPRHPGRLGLDPRLRRPALGLQAARRPVLPLPVPGAAAGRAGALLRRQRRARRAARARWACCRRPRSSSS